ncbi:MAG: hypothetical protein ABL953_12870 [Ilumatobacteraceae bacterium]
MLGACKTTTNTDTSVSIITQPATSVVDTTAATVAIDTIAPSTTDGTFNSLDATVWRLSTRNQRSACAACKAHAAHRYFVSAAAADADRAHAGCSCETREQRTTTGQVQEWFGEGGEVYDDRW